MKYYLHYIASGKSGIYGKDVFVKEAKQIGVNRSLPHFIIKKLKWGDKILLATFEGCHVGQQEQICDCEIQPCELHKKSMKFQDGIAHVFGYFIIEGLNITASNELKQKLYSQLDIVESINQPIQYKRSCGNYVIASSHRVMNSLADIIEKAQVLAKEMNEKVKYFIAGNFYQFGDEDIIVDNILINGVNFSRSLVEIDFDKIENLTDFGNYVGFIQDYNKKTYVPIKERV